MMDDPVSVLLGTQTRRGGSSSVRAVAASLALPLTLLSALLFLAGFWSPWVTGFATLMGGYGPGPSFPAAASGSGVSFSGLFSLIHLHPTGGLLAAGRLAWLGVLAMGWDVLPLCGVVLSLALWLRQGASRVLRGIYAAWLLVATAVVGVGSYGAVADFAGNRCEGNCATTPVIVHLWITWGLWLTLGALLLAWGAFGALARRRPEPRAERPTASTAAPVASLPPSRIALVGASVFTLGLFVWAAGLLLVPWVTAGCSGIPISITHFVRGSCFGLDGYDVLSAGLVNGPGSVIGAAVSDIADGLDVGLDPYRIIVLLLFAGVALALLLWRPGRLGREQAMRYTLPVAATAWVLLVVLAFLIGWEGTTYRLGHQGAVVFGGAPQVVGPGIWLSAAGMLLGGAGAGAVWLLTRRRYELP